MNIISPIILGLALTAVNPQHEEAILKTVSNSIYSDKYEDNNNFDTSTNLSPENFYDLDSYDVSIEASLDYTGQIVDLDYYHFTLFTDSFVSINAAANETTVGLFNFDLLNYDYYDTSEENAYHYPTSIYGNYDGSRNENYNCLLEAGTYFIFIQGRQNNSFTDELLYNLTINVKKEDRAESTYVYDLMKDNSKGAIWLSDLFPLKNNLLYNVNRNITYYSNQITNLHYRDYSLDALMKVSNGNPIKIAEYYIWDPVMRLAIKEFAFTLRNALYDEIKNNQIKDARIEIVKNTATGLFDLLLFAANNQTKIFPISISLDIIDYLGSVTLEKIFKLFYANPVDLNDLEYMNFLSTLIHVFDPRLPDSKSHTIDNVYQSNETIEVVRLPIFCSLHKSENIFPNFTTHYISLKDTSDRTFKEFDFHLSEVDKVKFSDDYDYKCRGKFYVINDFNDLNDFSNLALANTNHVHRENIHYCDICKIHIAPYSFTYIWNNTTNHKSVCSCGFVEVSGHVISNADFNNGQKFAKCLLCGGNAEKGFIEISNVNFGTTIVLSNGVIVI